MPFVGGGSGVGWLRLQGDEPPGSRALGACSAHVAKGRGSAVDAVPECSVMDAWEAVKAADIRTEAPREHALS